MFGGGGAGLGTLINPYTPEGWDIVQRESASHYCTLTVNDDSYTMEAKYIGGTVFDSYTAALPDGGYPGATPQDLLNRSLQPNCGSFVLSALTRVPDVEASVSPADSTVPGFPVMHVAANGILYGLPALFLLGLRRRFRKR